MVLEIAKVLFFLDGEADCAAELLTIKRILDRLALCIGRGRIERHSRLQRLTKRKWVAGIHRIITEKAVETAMHVVGAGFRHNVDGCATGPTEFGGIVAAVDLEFLHRILAQGQAHAALIVIGFATVHGHAVSPAIASVKRRSALGRLLHTKILVVSQPGRVSRARHQQGESKVIAAADR